MAYAWDHLDREGSSTGRSGPFGGQDAAEQWLSTSWEDLAASGVREVALLDLGTGEVVYRMSLGPEGES